MFSLTRVRRKHLVMSIENRFSSEHSLLSACKTLYCCDKYLLSQGEISVVMRKSELMRYSGRYHRFMKPFIAAKTVAVSEYQQSRGVAAHLISIWEVNNILAVRLDLHFLLFNSFYQLNLINSSFLQSLLFDSRCFWSFFLSQLVWHALITSIETFYSQ